MGVILDRCQSKEKKSQVGVHTLIRRRLKNRIQSALSEVRIVEKLGELERVGLVRIGGRIPYSYSVPHHSSMQNYPTHSTLPKYEKQRQLRSLKQKQEYLQSIKDCIVLESL